MVGGRAKVAPRYGVAYGHGMASESPIDHTAHGEMLTWDEMKARYPDEWVVFVDYDWSRMVIDRGVVVAHRPDRKALRELIRAHRECAVWWTGEIGAVGAMDVLDRVGPCPLQCRGDRRSPSTALLGGATIARPLAYDSE